MALTVFGHVLEKHESLLLPSVFSGSALIVRFEGIETSTSHLPTLATKHSPQTRTLLYFCPLKSIGHKLAVELADKQVDASNCILLFISNLFPHELI